MEKQFEITYDLKGDVHINKRIILKWIFKNRVGRCELKQA
jgi:hypothetical protein